MKVPNMNQCAVNARRPFPVLLRERVGLEQAEEGLDSAARYI